MALIKLDFKTILEKGKEMAIRNPIKFDSVQQIWVKKFISIKDWNEYYCHNNSYCDLGEEGFGKEKRKKISFVITGLIPSNCFELTPEELLQTDNYRRAYRVYPRPLTDQFPTL